MDGLIKPIKTTKKVQGKISKFEQLSLGEKDNPRKTSTNITQPIIKIKDSRQQEALLEPVQSKKLKTHPVPINPRLDTLQKRRRHDSAIFLQHSYLSDTPSKSLVDDAREILRSQPCQEDLKAVLEYLQYGIDGRHDFDIRVAGPRSAQVVNILVTNTVLDVWPNLDQQELSVDEAQMKKTLITCLSSPVGIGALLAHTRQSSTSKLTASGAAVVSTLVAVLAEILAGQKTIARLLNQCMTLYQHNDMQRNMAWQEFVKQLAAGQILGVVAQAFSHAQLTDNVQRRFLCGAKGADCFIWLAKNIAYTAVKLQPLEVDSWKCLGQMLGRGLSLGHRDLLVSELYSSFLLGQRALWTPLHQLLKQLTTQEQRQILDEILHDLSKKYLDEIMSVDIAIDGRIRKAIAGAAALISGIVKQSEPLREHLENWLIVANASHATVGLASRRALIAVLSETEGTLERILERALSNFGDKLQIQHNSTLQQEACAQGVLLIVGRLNCQNPLALKRPPISSLVMRSVSNRLATSVPRARFLGMIVGVAVSRLVDEPNKVLNFDLEEMDSEEASKLLALPTINDSIGEISDLQPLSTSKSRLVTSQPPKRSAKTLQTPTQARTSKIIAIEEVSDSSSSEDEDLIPYRKPDSDPEDSDEDPTLINRSKPSAPVYIVDLVKHLTKSDQLDTIELALKTAPSLIRRKIGFGTEITDNIHSLATSLINLQEGMSDSDLQQLRVDSLIACVVAAPDRIAPSLTKLYFEGDFSISQRVVILTSLALGSRGLAGFKDSSSDQSSETSIPLFPSKRLPSHLEPKSISYISPMSGPISALAYSAAQSTIQPMALAAADKMTGPNILKIRHFSSRMEVQKRAEAKSQARTKVVPKQLHLILVKSFSLPLCSRLSLLASYASTSLTGSNSYDSRTSPTTTLLQPHLLKLSLQTLTLYLHTLGPLATLHLPTLTPETLSLLTSISQLPTISTDPLVLPALLHLLLALLDLTIEAGISAQEKLIVDHGKVVSELVSWAAGLGEKIAIPDANEVEESKGMPWSVLAAGIQVKWVEMGQRFQGRMLGLSLNGDFGGGGGF